MFDRIATQLAPDRSDSPVAAAPALESNELLERIIARLEQDVPQGMYVTDKWLAKALAVEMKTLINRRRDKPGLYPQPIRFPGLQGTLHVRRELIEWLAREELRAKTRHLHKCN